MLLRLDIKNAALIESQELEINSGMTVLTGETGAGKSVMINALNLICGARISKNPVRYGEKKAVIQAVLESRDLPELEKNGIETEDGLVIVTREISADGRSVCRINGTIVPQNIVREIMQRLINIHGQHDSRELLSRSKHIALLDSYAKNDALISGYDKHYDEKKKIETELSALEADEENRLQRIDLLTSQIGELEKAALKKGEKEELLSERNIMRSSEKLSENLGGAYSLLYDDEGAAYDRISEAESMLSAISDIDHEFESLFSRMSEIKYNLEDISHEIYQKMSKIEYDEQALDEIEERLDVINKLERKYGGSTEAAIEYLEKSKKELSGIENREENIERLQNELEKVMQCLKKAADELSKSRKNAAKNL